MAKKRRQQADQKADLRGEGFVGLPRVVFDSEAWRRGLSSFDRDVHLQILARFNGYNNGHIVVSQRQISDAIGNSNFRKIGRSIARQIEVGLLDIATESVWKQRHAREYRLTYCSTSRPPFIIAASNEYKAWKYDADDVSAEQAPSADAVSAGPKAAADDVSARIAGKSRKCVTVQNPSADDESSLIIKPSQGAANSRGKTPLITGGPKLAASISRISGAC